MLLTNLLLACGLSTAVGSGLALKDNSNYLYHEKPQEQLHLDNKKNTVTGALQIGVWYTWDVYDDDYNGSLVECSTIINGAPVGFIRDSYGVVYPTYSWYLEDSSCNFILLLGFEAQEDVVINTQVSGSDISFMFTNDANMDSDLLAYLALNSVISINQGSSTTEEVFEVVGDTTTGFVGVLTSAFAGMTSLIYNNGEFTILGVLLLIATGVSLVYWIFRLIRGVTSGVAR